MIRANHLKTITLFIGGCLIALPTSNNNTKQKAQATTSQKTYTKQGKQRLTPDATPSKTPTQQQHNNNLKNYLLAIIIGMGIYYWGEYIHKLYYIYKLRNSTNTVHLWSKLGDDDFYDDLLEDAFDSNESAEAIEFLWSKVGKKNKEDLLEVAFCNNQSAKVIEFLWSKLGKSDAERLEAALKTKKEHNWNLLRFALKTEKEHNWNLLRFAFQFNKSVEVSQFLYEKLGDSPETRQTMFTKRKVVRLHLKKFEADTVTAKPILIKTLYDCTTINESKEVQEWAKKLTITPSDNRG